MREIRRCLLLGIKPSRVYLQTKPHSYQPCNHDNWITQTQMNTGSHIYTVLYILANVVYGWFSNVN